MRMAAAGAVAIIATWALASALMAVHASSTFGLRSLGAAEILRSVTGCAAVCVAIGGPSTGTALWLRQRVSIRRAVLGGGAVGAIGFVIVFLLIARTGSAAVTAILPVLLVLIVEFSLAFRGQRRGLRVTK